MTQRTAVVLFNLGGPDSLQAVRPFLFNLFSDADIFRLPLAVLTQKPFAWMLSRARNKVASTGYAAIGGKSPLLENTQRQARALAKALTEYSGRYEVFPCMRYWPPLTDGVVRELKAANVEDVRLLPLYPQYSVTTTGSSYNEFRRQCQRYDYHPRVRLLESWYAHATYQEAILGDVRSAALALPDPDPKHFTVLFSAHGLPQKVINRGDPYQQQIEATFDSLREQLGWPHCILCYQSRVGPLTWLEPYTMNVIRKLGRQGIRQVLVYPIAFVSDHAETLYELGIQYAELAKAVGIEHYRVVPALNDSRIFIRALAELVLSTAELPARSL